MGLCLYMTKRLATPAVNPIPGSKGLLGTLFRKKNYLAVYGFSILVGFFEKWIFSQNKIFTKS